MTEYNTLLGQPKTLDMAAHNGISFIPECSSMSAFLPLFCGLFP